jgi:uncharacterized tellurite resistance protein B-like protein
VSLAKVPERDGAQRARDGSFAVGAVGKERVQGRAARPLAATGALRLFAAMLVGVILAAAAPVAAEDVANAAPTKVVIFPFELVDTSQEGEADGARADQEARLTRLTADLKAQLAASGRYEIVALTAEVEADYARLAPMRGCNGCDIDLAKAVGATQGMVGIVQKVSNLILDIAIYVRDVDTGRVVQVAKTSIRGNTDESWQRGLRFLVDKRLLAADQGGAAD